ncbi:hypothetical protein [Jatrophihabitans sp.]|uniref:hypothetical protein n=1 Tax=Jatrophihabitans sp. TaxID=1932789 RepID=UPI0030C6D3B3|nr:hypothetical protein [Jatrophihabitans sp.]
MIAGSVFCPHPPVLVPELAGAAAPELDELRAACLGVIASAAATGHQLVLLGSGPSSQLHSPLSRGTLAGFGLPGDVHLGAPTCGGALELPLSLTIGAWLVREALGPRSGALGVSVGPDYPSSKAAVKLLTLAETRDLVLVVMGDGSARRTTAAPGYFDERAEPFDASVSAALAAGDADALDGLDLDLAHALLSAGAPAWRAAGGLLAGADYAAELSYDAAPYGVGYFVASWTLATP